MAVLPDLLAPFALLDQIGSESWRKGMSNLGLLPMRDRELLTETWRDTARVLAGRWEESLARLAIFWVNLWQASESETKLEIARIAELDAWVLHTARTHYGADIVLDGYGLIVNPVGSALQAWHLDYTVDYSTIFIPLTDLTPENALQYLDLGDDVPEGAYRLAVTDPDKVDLSPILQSGGTIGVRQLLAPSYSLLKLDFGVIHRGIANAGPSERVVFWISVRRGGGSPPVEPLVQNFEAGRSSDAFVEESQ